MFCLFGLVCLVWFVCLVCCLCLSFNFSFPTHYPIGTGMNFLIHNMCRLPQSGGQWTISFSFFCLFFCLLLLLFYFYFLTTSIYAEEGWERSQRDWLRALCVKELALRLDAPFLRSSQRKISSPLPALPSIFSRPSVASPFSVII